MALDAAPYIQTYTHTHCCFTALCPGLPGWANTRRDIYPLTPETCCGVCHHSTALYTLTMKYHY